jgi:hypothetical protein
MGSVASTIVNGFDDPHLRPWWFDAIEADHFLDTKAREASATASTGVLRKALGQFTTGVAVITTRALDGRRMGMTANSRRSPEPPLCCGASQARRQSG